jgi:SARP family transcriptional regulator, regulator of embCAB operon
MEIKVLGPLHASARGGSIVPTAGKPRQVLALLALYPGQVMPVPTLMEEIWATDLPRSALTTLQTYILQLRRRISSALGPEPRHGSKDVLVTRHGGYMLQVPPESVDAHHYERLVAAGREAFSAGHDERAAQLFRQALALWHGPPLVDVRVGPILEIEVMRLEESRLETLERRIGADLRLGRHAALLTELTALTARHPLHEGLHSQAMVALYRAGRRAQALDLYRLLRERFIEELGLEPSAQLQRLHQAMLAADPVLDPGEDARRGPIYDLFAVRPV